MPSAAASWSGYLQEFHAERPGITEAILDRCRSDGVNPYRWVAEALEDGDGVVVDIACGSAPMRSHLAKWIGTDVSASELALAANRNRGPVVRASAIALPLASHTADTVVCTMALQIIQPPDAAVAEIGRVVRTGGRVVLLLPATAPLPWRDVVRYLRLQIALRQQIRYPNDRHLGSRSLRTLAAPAGLQVCTDVTRTFSLPIDTAEHADELLRSLYLPGVTPSRLHRARRLVHGWTGDTLSVPLRRVVLEPATQP